MTREFHFADESYSLDVRQDGEHISLRLEFKKQEPKAVPQRTTHVGQSQKVVLPANEHHRRQGVLEDEATVIAQGDGVFEVESRTEPGAWHVVRLQEGGEGACTCAAYTLGGNRNCRHLRAVRIVAGYPPDAAPRARSNGAQENEDLSTEFPFALLTQEPSAG